MRCFNSKVVVITGSGIGRCLAQQCAEKGARLALSDINVQGLQQTLDSLPAGTDVRHYRFRSRIPGLGWLFEQVLAALRQRVEHPQTTTR